MTSLTAAELRALCSMADASDYFELRDKLALMIAERSAVREWGARVFSWCIPLTVERIATKGKSAGKAITIQLAPTLNIYSQQEPWQRTRTSNELDLRIMAELHKWPNWRHEGRARAVRVTRYSSHEIDEATVDCAGGKQPVDRLVHAGVLRGDAPADLEREGRWAKAPPGLGHLLVEVYELATKA
jgi:hypothetical protein